jgi:hypothetical protein
MILIGKSRSKVYYREVGSQSLLDNERVALILFGNVIIIVKVSLVDNKCGKLFNFQRFIEAISVKPCYFIEMRDFLSKCFDILVGRSIKD